VPRAAEIGRAHVDALGDHVVLAPGVRVGGAEKEHGSKGDRERATGEPARSEQGALRSAIGHRLGLLIPVEAV
jgi:hypothetical protein